MKCRVTERTAPRTGKRAPKLRTSRRLWSSPSRIPFIEPEKRASRLERRTLAQPVVERLGRKCIRLGVVEPLAPLVRNSSRSRVGEVHWVGDRSSDQPDELDRPAV